MTSPFRNDTASSPTPGTTPRGAGLVAALILLATVATTISACDEATTPDVADSIDAVITTDIAGTDNSEVAIADVGSDTADTIDTADTAEVDTTPQPLDELQVGDNACCMTFTDTKAVWAELEYVDDATCDVGTECFGEGCKGFRTGPDTFVCRRLMAGQVWIYDRASATKTALDSGSSAIQKDPVISGSNVIWADRRNGNDFDLWQHNLDTGTSSALVIGLGDQDEPTLDGNRLAWIGRNAEPHGAAEREVWTMDIKDPDSKERLTNDTMEQTQPHCSGGRIVWADYGADPDGVYNPIADPLSNNGDIVGYDLSSKQFFTVVAEESKQTRPAIDGDFVVWLDWRGINPEPKYSAFQVYGARISPQLTVDQSQMLAASEWKRPSLWQRPTVNASGLAGWIQEGGAGELSAVFVATIGPNPNLQQLVATNIGFFDGVQMLDNQIGYVGAGKLGWFPLDSLGSLPQ